MKSKIAALDKFLEEKDHHIGKLNAIIQEMKERQGSRIQYIQKGEIGKYDLLRNIRAMREEIISPKERRPKPTERDTEDHHRIKEVTLKPQRKHPMITNDQKKEPMVVLLKRKKKKRGVKQLLSGSSSRKMTAISRN